MAKLFSCCGRVFLIQLRGVGPALPSIQRRLAVPCGNVLPARRPGRLSDGSEHAGVVRRLSV